MHYFTIAEILTSQKKYESAKEKLTQYLKVYPKGKFYNKALYLRGTLYYYLNDPIKAINDLQQVVNSKNFEERDYATLFLTYTLWELNRENEAIEMFANLLLTTQDNKLKENLNPDLLIQMGNTFIMVNKYSAAAMCFSILGKHDDFKTKILGLIGQGKIKFHQKEFGDAIKLFYQIKEDTEKFPELRGQGLAYLGESLRRLDRLDEAFVIFEEASNLMYDDSKAKALVRLGIAKIYFANQKHEESLRYAISVYVLYDDPEYSPEAMLIAIRILISRNRIDEAKATYQELEARYPGSLASYKSRKENNILFDKLISNKLSSD